MKIPKEARKISRELYQASLQNGRLDQGRVQTIARHLGASKPRHYGKILHNYARLVRLELARRHAVVESATVITEQGRSEMESSLRAKYGDDITIEFTTVPELIGGLRIKIGSDVFDSSVRERLERLEASVHHS